MSHNFPFWINLRGKTYKTYSQKTLAKPLQLTLLPFFFTTYVKTNYWCQTNVWFPRIHFGAAVYHVGTVDTNLRRIKVSSFCESGSDLLNWHILAHAEPRAFSANVSPCVAPQAEISSLQQLLLSKNTEIESLHSQLLARPPLSPESSERGKQSPRPQILILPA